MKERLLTAVGAASDSDDVRTLRMDHQRAHYETETKKAVRAASMTSVPGAGLDPHDQDHGRKSAESPGHDPCRARAAMQKRPEPDHWRKQDPGGVARGCRRCRKRRTLEHSGPAQPDAAEQGERAQRDRKHSRHVDVPGKEGSQGQCRPPPGIVERHPDEDEASELSQGADPDSGIGRWKTERMPLSVPVCGEPGD